MLAAQRLPFGGQVDHGGAQAHHARAVGGAGEEVAEFLQLHAQHRRQAVALGRVARLGGGGVGREDGAALAQVFAQALLHQVRGRLAPAGQAVGAQLLGVGVLQPVEHGGAALGQAGRIHLGQGQRGQRGASVGGCRGQGAGTKVVQHGPRGRRGQGRAACQKNQAK